MKRPKKRPIQRTGEADSIGDSPEYLATWAAALVKADKAEARIALAGYQALAANRELDKADRDIARKRAKAIERIL
jgi:hypothetical protein